MVPQTDGPATFEKREWLVAILSTVVVMALHVVNLLHAGALWRDEAGLASLSTLPTFGDVWGMLTRDHCPIVVPALIRVWSATGWGATDFGLRVFGLIVGLLLLASIWLASLVMRRRPPLLALALVALNAMVIRSGDSIRGYGLGSAMAVVSLALTWRAVRRPTTMNGVFAMIAAIVSVQCLYQNAVFVFATGCGGALVCAMERRRRGFIWAGLIGIGAALSLLPYVHPISGAEAWWKIARSGYRFSDGWDRAALAVNTPLPGLIWLWTALCVCGILLTLRTAVEFRNQSDPRGGERAIFCGASLTVALAGFAAFLKHANLPSQAWYYLPLLAFAVVCLEAVLAESNRLARPAFAVFAVIATIGAVPAGLPVLRSRLTNVDLVAEHLSKSAGTNDLIILQPWYCGVSFARYYNGPAPWTTIPEIADHKMHRYDLVAAGIQQEHAARPVLDKIQAALAAGGRVWVVGWMVFDKSPPPEPRPAPNNPWGWMDQPYYFFYGAMAGSFILNHAGAVVPEPVPCGQAVNPFEDLPVHVTPRK